MYFFVCFVNGTVELFRFFLCFIAEIGTIQTRHSRSHVCYFMNHFPLPQCKAIGENRRHIVSGTHDDGLDMRLGIWHKNEINAH